jgi:pimeloyl-ACP methyl ester carboxylesterase
MPVLRPLGALALALLPACHADTPPMHSPLRSRVVPILGGKVHVLEAGPADAPAVLLLHGQSFRATTWKDNGTLAALAAAGRRAVALDLPGYGDSPANDIADARDPTAFVGATLDALGIERPVLVSPSMSGRFALPFASAHPDRLAGFVPIAPAGVERFADALARATAPTLVVWGEQDQVRPVAEADELASLMPNAETAILAGCGHACYLDDPAAFHAALLAFVERVQPLSGR